MIFKLNFLKLAGVAVALFAASPASCADTSEPTPDASPQMTTPVSPITYGNIQNSENSGYTDIPGNGEIGGPLAPYHMAVPSDDMSAIGESVDIDPRNGVCTMEELTNLNLYFSKTPNPCLAYKCIDEEMIQYKESIMAHYPDFGSEETIEDLAGVFAGCHCRCPVMKCEVDYMESNGTKECYQSTLKYCAESNTGFTTRCTEAAKKMPKVYDLDLDAQAFSKPCQVCTPKTEPSLEPVAVATPNSGANDSTINRESAQNIFGALDFNLNEVSIDSSVEHSNMDTYYLGILTTSSILSFALYW